MELHQEVKYALLTGKLDQHLDVVTKALESRKKALVLEQQLNDDEIWVGEDENGLMLLDAHGRVPESKYGITEIGSGQDCHYVALPDGETAWNHGSGWIAGR